VGSLQEQEALLQPATGAVQTTHRLNEGIADAADQLAARVRSVQVRGGARRRQIVLRRRSLR
jgi:hypothetical protein